MQLDLLQFSLDPRGVLRVLYDRKVRVNVLLLDDTVRGVQSVRPARAGRPLGHWSPSGALGSVLATWDPPQGARRVAVVGVGAGSAAAYARPGTHVLFLEPDERFAAAAQDEKLFTFVARCEGTCEIAVADPLRALAALADGSLGMLVLDALVDHRVPPEQLTREALELYRRKLAPDGVLVVHFDVATGGAQVPALEALARETGMAWRDRLDPERTAADRARGKLPARCVVLARDAGTLAWLRDAPPWTDEADAGDEAEGPDEGAPGSAPDSPETSEPEPVRRTTERFFPGEGGLEMLLVDRDTAAGMRVLLHKGIHHGMQLLDPARADEPLGYYDRGGPLGDVFAGWQPQGRAGRVCVIGLGVGVMAAFARPGQHFTFYELDPRIETIARDESLFTYLARCRGATEVVIGDGRASLERAVDGAFDMIVVDAFVGVEMPAAFVSADALALYRRKLAPDGLVVFHINSTGARLPLLRELARSAGMSCSDRADLALSPEEIARHKAESHFVVLAPDASLVPWLRDSPRWTTVLPGS